ncbi:4-alpha-glucanotransferase, partial [Xenorhabdus bovienii]|nr:4-alpha-glucanotransferase [Xenorhabdus bovienii]
GESIGLYPDKTLLAELHTDRKRCKQELLANLIRHGYLPKPETRPTENAQNASQQTTLSKQAELPMSVSINQAIHRYIAHSNCALLGLQPEDWLDMAN